MESTSNRLRLTGVVLSSEVAFTSDRKLQEEKFYHLELEVPRLSGTSDIIPVICTEKLLFDLDIQPGKVIQVEGGVHTRNYVEEGTDRKRLGVFAYAYDITEVSDDDELDPVDQNTVELQGVICRETRPRKTARTNRSITDMILAVKRYPSEEHRRKKDYIPCIAWGHNAVLASKRKVGDVIKLIGRLQSRKYYSKTEQVERTAYEVSIIDLQILDSEEVKHNHEVTETAEAVETVPVNETATNETVSES